MTALHASARTGKLRIMNKLLQLGVDPSTTDISGATALHTAVSGGQLAAARLLVEAGCNPKLRTRAGWTPIHFAFDLQDKKLISYLLSVGADLADLEPVNAEEVRWATLEPWYPQLTLKHSCNTATSQVGDQVDEVPFNTVLEVYNLLHTALKLPAGVVGTVLDMAEYWVHSMAISKEEIIVVESSEQKPYVLVKVSECLVPIQVRKIAFTTKSHDQG